MAARQRGAPRLARRPGLNARPLTPGSPMTADASSSPELAEGRRRLAELESLVQNSPVAVVVLDSDERVTDWNPAATELFGYSAEEALGRPIDELVVGAEGRNEGREVTNQAITTGRAQRI